MKANTKTRSKNIALLLGPPVLILALLAAAVYAPKILANPQQDFIYATCEHQENCFSDLVLENGKLIHDKSDPYQSEEDEGYSQSETFNNELPDYSSPTTTEEYYQQQPDKNLHSYGGDEPFTDESVPEGEPSSPSNTPNAQLQNKLSLVTDMSYRSGDPGYEKYYRSLHIRTLDQAFTPPPRLNKPALNFYRLDSKTGESKPITIEEAKRYTLSGSDTSTDGYSLNIKDADSRAIYNPKRDKLWILSKDSLYKEIDINPSYHIGYNEHIYFIGWIEK